MPSVARRLTTAALLAAWVGAMSLESGCQNLRQPPPQNQAGSKPPVLAADALLPSPRLFVGRIVAVNPIEGFAFVEVGADAPASALVDGTELIVRTLSLQERARVRVSRYIRGRTLGARILTGQATPGDEVVWLAP